ncbi:MAG: Rrf2 family transcriptional regulator [Candidatus Latescibacterota bacterium]
MLSLTSHYALRALVRLAQLDEGVATPGHELAVAEGIPRNYLCKIMADMRRAGLVSGARGRGGGYRLRRPAATLSLIEVVELFDGPRTRCACLLGWSQCSDTHRCSGHAAWRALRNRCLAFLESTTLKQIASPAAGAAKGAGGCRAGRPSTAGLRGRAPRGAPP